MLSSSQFTGQSMQYSQPTPPPLALSATTTGSAAQATAWRNSSLAGENRPLSLSKKTAGTTYKFDDSTPTALPASDKGVGRNAE